MQHAIDERGEDLHHVRPLSTGAKQVCVRPVGDRFGQLRFFDLNAHKIEHCTTLEPMGTPIAQPVTGLLLAAGQGSRMGVPKAVLEIGSRTLTEMAVEALLDGGCADVLVVLGADAQRVRTRMETNAAIWGDRVDTTECANWSGGMSKSLRTGLATLAARGRRCPQATLIHLVDLPDVGAEVVSRILQHGRAEGRLAQALVRPTYQGVAGHPTLLGQSHWQGVMDSACGDQGAGPYVRSREAAMLACDDLALGRDVDTPTELSAYLDQRKG